MFPKARLKEPPSEIIYRKVQYLSAVDKDYIFDPLLVQQYGDLYKKHRNLLAIDKGQKIQKSLSQNKNVLIWRPTKDFITKYNIYDLFFAQISPEALNPNDIQGHFAYFYTFYLLRWFLATDVEETPKGIFVIFTQDYQALYQYVEESLKVIEDWSLENQDEIDAFISNTQTHLPSADEAAKELKRIFDNFYRSMKGSAFQQWNYYAYLYRRDGDLSEILKHFPELQDIYEIQSSVSEDFTKFPKNLYAPKKFPSSPKMLFDLLEGTSVDKEYFIEQYNSIPKPNIEKLRAYFDSKFKPIYRSEAANKYIDVIQQLFYDIVQLQLPNYNDDVFDNLSEMRHDTYLKLQDYDRELRKHFQEVTQGSDTPHAKLKALSSSLKLGSLFTPYRLQLDTILWDTVDEYQDFLDNLHTDIAFLEKIQKIPLVPTFPLPSWPDLDVLPSIEWLVSEGSEILLDLDLPAFLNHAIYNYFTSYQLGMEELMRAFDRLEATKSTFNSKWWLIRWQIFDYLRAILEIHKRKLLPDEFMFSNFETFEDFISGVAEFEDASQIMLYISKQIPNINEMINNLNNKIEGILGAIKRITAILKEFPRPQANFQQTLKEVKDFISENNIITVLRELDRLLSELGTALDDAADYWEAYYEFAFTRNFHLIIQWQISDFYESFEKLNKMSWDPQLQDVRLETLQSWMRTSKLAFALGMRQLHAVLKQELAVKSQEIEAFLDVFQKEAVKDSWYIVIKKLPLPPEQNANALWILPYIEDYNILKV